MDTEIKKTIPTVPATSGSNISISIHSHEQIIDELATEWNELTNIANSVLCCSHLWIKNWWNYYGRGEQRNVFIVTIRSDNKLIAILPFYKGYSKIGDHIVSERLQLIGAGGSPKEQWGYSDQYGISDYMDFIIHPDFQEECADLINNLFKSDDFAGFTIYLHQIREDSYIYNFIYPLLKESGFTTTLKQTDSCPYVELSEISSLDQYLKSVKSSARRRLRQTLKAANKSKEYSIEEAQDKNDLDAMITTLIDLHQNRWNALGYTGAFYDVRFQKFFRQLVYDSWENDTLWFKQTRDDEGISSSRMLLKFNNRYYDYMSGFEVDSPSSKYRPGIGLLINNIEDAIKTGIKRVDLLRGLEQYKFDFTNSTIETYSLKIGDRKNNSLSERLEQKIITLLSTIYKYSSKEKKLLKVQYDAKGLIPGIAGYFGFRYETLQNKLKQ